MDSPGSLLLFIVHFSLKQLLPRQELLKTSQATASVVSVDVKALTYCTHSKASLFIALLSFLYIF